MPPKRTAAVRSETSQAAVPTSKKSKIEPADPPPDPIPNGLEAAKSEITKRVESTRKEPCRHRPDVLYKLGNALKGDPEGVLRGLNTSWIHEQMERDAQVNAAFASLRQTLEEGKPAPRIENPYIPHIEESPFAYDDDWEMFSSEVFTKYLFDELDQIDFKYWGVNRGVEFYDPNSALHEGKCGGIIKDIRELEGKLKAFDMPQHASLDPIIVKTTSRCRRIKMWFAGNGCMRMQCEMGSKADFRNGDTTTVVWSCLQRTKERKEREAKEWQEEAKANGTKQRQEQQDKEQREFVKQIKEQALGLKHEDGEMNSSELEVNTAGKEDDDDEEELLESDHSSAPPDSPPSSIGEMDWTETEEEEENGN